MGSSGPFRHNHASVLGRGSSLRTGSSADALSSADRSGRDGPATRRNSAAACTNDLTFLEDLTVPDGTLVPPDLAIDKQWLVSNSGSCNWDSRYALKLVGGDALGAPREQALFPARAGTRAVVRIRFVGPSAPGRYGSTWQAFGPDDVAFGAEMFLDLVVGD